MVKKTKKEIVYNKEKKFSQQQNVRLNINM